MANLKETLEIYGALDSMTRAIDESLKDGKLNVMDIPTFIPVLPSLWRAINGIDGVAAELKDLNEDELKILTMRSVKTVSDFIKVLKKVKDLNDSEEKA